MGRLTNRNLRNSSDKNLSSEPTTHGSVAGYNPESNSTLVNTNRGTVAVRGSESRPNDEVLVTSNNSQRGSRDLKATPTGKRVVTFQSQAVGSSSPSTKVDPDLCKPINRFELINPPEEPDPPTDEPESEDEEKDPNDTETPPTDDPVSVPYGCNPGDPAKWYARECPVGSSSIGTYTDASEVTWNLCKPVGRELDGDGCPIQPGLYGWSCVDGVATYVLNGAFATQEECICEPLPDEPNPGDEGSYDPPLTYSPGTDSCSYDPEGSYTSLAECNDDNGFSPGRLFRARILTNYNTIKPFTDAFGFCPGKGTTYYAEMFDTGSVAAWQNFYTPISTYTDGSGNIHITGFNDIGMTSPKDVNTGVNIASLENTVYNGWAYLYTPPASDVCSSATFNTAHRIYRNITWTLQKEMLS